MLVSVSNAFSRSFGTSTLFSLGLSSNRLSSFSICSLYSFFISRYSSSSIVSESSLFLATDILEFNLSISSDIFFLSSCGVFINF
ncbi:hypothetical protein [Chryseobacterium flavum]|uniref:hypothetical protein n=1 Tax=Chryseobacterium flavum TaxID=415851 RepID=UPI0028AFEE30|nr:hypothetical protein [Chryseobacterium flavum]